MKALKIALALLGFALVAVVGYAIYLGAFNSVELRKTEMSATDVVYSTHKGHYKKLNASWSKFLAQLREKGFDDCKSFGIYLDSPDTPKEELRSILACSLEGVNPAMVSTLKESFSTFTLPATDAYVATFPHKSEASFFVGPMKVYPEFQKLIATDVIRPSVAIEDYGDVEGQGQIHYYMPTSLTPQAFQPLFDAF